MKRQARRMRKYSLGVLVCLGLFGVWFVACARQEAPPRAAQKAPQASAAPANRAAEEAAIRQALHRYVDQGDSTGKTGVDLAQISIDSGYALVSWMHGEKGGQAVLRKEGGVWKVKECGPGWLGLRGVCKEQVPVEVAKRLLNDLDPNWPGYETY
ncbi:MAG: hypothetical protein WAM82_18210 [Thermoanaerobaculia bacterium]